MRSIPSAALWCAVTAVPLAAQTQAATGQAAFARERPSIEAVAARSSPPVIDGRLDEEIWRVAPAASGFTLREPVEGEPAPEATEVRFAYDDEALYVGARMHSQDASAVRALVTRRDRETSSEQLIVSLDSNLDGRTAYSFGVTAAGVRIDYYHPGDEFGHRDYSFDPVWEAATSLDAEGWSAEVRIPFTQLRFNPGTTQTWGVNVVRLTPSRNEEAFWVLVRREEAGWASRMGRLRGLTDMAASRRLELLPYVSADATLRENIDAADPFVQERDAGVRAGADVKLGLGPNLTLDATINPDFGQVEADPAEVNLTAFETFFAERRPFFVEGGQLFGGRGTFYSRRIGAPPPLEPDAPYFETVDNTTILGAAKLTGRLPSGLSIGALGALTAEESVETYDPATDAFGTALVAPRTGYGVVTVQQEFGPNASTLSATATAVRRDIEAGSPLADLVVREAYTALMDGRLRWADGAYDASAYIGISHVAGEPGALLAQQRSSRRYFQRPDADYVELDPTRTSLTGVTAGINHSKMAGSWLWNIDYVLESPGLELNDVGALGAADDQGLYADLLYRRTTPGRFLHNWHAGVYEVTEWNFGGARNLTQVGGFTGVTWRNFWETGIEVGHATGALSDKLTRGGPLMRTARAWYADVAVENSSGSRTGLSAEAFGRRDEHDGWVTELQAGVTIRPGARWELSIEPRWMRAVESRQYVGTFDGGPAATFGQRYVFARVDRSELASPVRLNYALRPNLTLETYLEPFASAGRFHGFGELAAARSAELRVYGSEGSTIERDDDGYTITDGADSFRLADHDFDIRSLRSNLVLRWEWRPGSTAYLVWQQNRFVDDGAYGAVGPAELGDAFGTRGDQFVALKVSYWIPM
ncbi:MAG: DUF5916 domain-containing protein [Longimicrobiales bacterium]